MDALAICMARPKMCSGFLLMIVEKLTILQKVKKLMQIRTSRRVMARMMNRQYLVSSFIGSCRAGPSSYSSVLCTATIIACRSMSATSNTQTMARMRLKGNCTSKWFSSYHKLCQFTFTQMKPSTPCKTS